MAPKANKIEKMPKNLLSLYWIISKRVHRLVASPLVSSGWDGSGLEKSLKLTKGNNKASLKKNSIRTSSFQDLSDKKNFHIVKLYQIHNQNAFNQFKKKHINYS